MSGLQLSNYVYVCASGQFRLYLCYNIKAARGPCTHPYPDTFTVQLYVRTVTPDADPSKSKNGAFNHA